MSERIGFFICHCGINIAYRVRVKEVAEYAATFPGVVSSNDYLFMCSDPGQELIEKEIKEHNLTRVVVAACSKQNWAPHPSTVVLFIYKHFPGVQLLTLYLFMLVFKAVWGMTTANISILTRKLRT